MPLLRRLLAICTLYGILVLTSLHQWCSSYLSQKHVILCNVSYMYAYLLFSLTVVAVWGEGYTPEVSRAHLAEAPGHLQDGLSLTLWPHTQTEQTLEQAKNR